MQDDLLTDDLEKLFHEKGMTGPAAWSRLFNETLTSLRFEIGGESFAIETVVLLRFQLGQFGTGLHSHSA